MAQPIWDTTAGLLGTYPASINASLSVLALPVLPAISVSYTLLSGSLPNGMTLLPNGLVTGTPALVPSETEFVFSVRATDNLGSIRDRTFSIIISGTTIPSFTTPSGTLLSTNDSVWIDLPILFNNPDSNNVVKINVIEGILPPGLEINEAGLIRGYPLPPTITSTLPTVVTSATVTDTSNVITCLSTSGFAINRPIVFTGTVFGGIEVAVTYYIKTIIDSLNFTISTTPNGPTLNLTNGSGLMTATLSAISVGQPTIRTYNFSLQLSSLLGDDISSYSITVINQNTPTSQGGPGFPVNNRIPTILNTRPETFNLSNNNIYFGYYVLPPIDAAYNTYPTNIPAFIGTIQSNNYFAFKVIGHDFDSNEIRYVYSGLPLGLVGDNITGWITGTPTIMSEGINQYTFSVAVYKLANPAIQSPFFNFSFNLSNDITGIIIWQSPTDLGQIYNGTVSNKSILATSDTYLEYRIVSGSLPPNLSLLSNGEITGYVANQPTNTVLSQDTTTTFTFTIQAFSPIYPVVSSEKEFTINVVQAYTQPTDILYIKATPSIVDRELIESLLTNQTLIPDDYLYRPNDVYFGKATAVIYEHAYGIYASNIDEYIASVTRNHYWRNITLGEIKTAQARDENNNVIYEVVYSQVVDNLVNNNDVSVSKELDWPIPINLNLGPWYTSVTNIFTSYSDVSDQLYYTSLSPGFTQTVYPNSLHNMRTQVAQVLGQEYDNKLLPAWMTSQQQNGSTLGFTQAWVICYTKPGFSAIIKNNIDTLWKQPNGLPNKLNMINFKIDRFSVNKSITYNYDKYISPPVWTGLPSARPVPDPLDSKDFYVLFPRATILPR